MRKYRQFFILSALCLHGCSSLNSKASDLESEREKEFLDWLVSDSIEKRDERVGGYSHSLASETEGFPFPSPMDVESSYLAIVEGAEEKGKDFSEAAEDYWKKNLTPVNVEILLEVPENCALVRKVSVPKTPASQRSQKGSISVEQWEAGPAGYLYTISKPGFNRSGDLAVVYFGLRDGVLGGGWGEMRIYEKGKGEWEESEMSYQCNWVACGLMPRRGD